MSTTNPFANLFRSSPFKAMQKHMRVVIECVDEVPGMFQALVDKDQALVAQHKDKIFELEDNADKLKNTLRQHLPRGLFLPVDRRDLLEILDVQDSIADVAQDVAGLLVERDMTVPDEMAKPLLELVEKCVQVAHKSLQAIEEFDELIEIGFKGRGMDNMETILNELNKVEDVTDELGMELTRILFKREDSMKPVSVMFWYQLVQWVGDIADNAEKVGNRLRLLTAR